MQRIVRTLAFVALAVVPSVSPAQGAPTSGFRAEYLKQLVDVEQKLVSLAEAIPQESYGWRPGKDVRSIGEVYLHIAGSNFGIPEAMAMKSPVRMDKDFETKDATNKAYVIDMLKKSLVHSRQVALRTTDGELGHEVSLFGGKYTKLAVLFLLANHMHEHMGQSIAYARVAGIVPPWSRGKGM